MGTQPPPQKEGRSPQFSAFVYCGQTAAWIKMALGMEVGLGPDDIVLDGVPALPSPKGGRAPSPIFVSRRLWPNSWMDQGGTWHGGGPWSRPHCARWVSPSILAHFYCGQTAGCIKMPLGMDVGLSPGDFGLDGDPVPLPKKAAEPPSPKKNRPMFIVAKRLDGSRWHLAWRQASAQATLC